MKTCFEIRGGLDHNKQIMNFLKEELQLIPEKKIEQVNSYEGTFGWISRDLFLFHTIDNLFYMRNINSALKQQETWNLADLKNIKAEDSSFQLGPLISESYKKLINQKEENDLDGQDLMWMAAKMFKQSVLKLLVISVLCLSAVLALNYLIPALFKAVSDSNVKMGLILTLIMAVLWICFLNGRIMVNHQVYQISERIKSCLSLLLYSKIITMTPLSIGPQIGTFTNLIINDLEQIHKDLEYMVITPFIPLVIIGITVSIYSLIGWVGLISVVLLILLTPLNFLISEKNGELLKEINGFKDKRVKITQEVIESIKSIKLYGWEVFFKKIITALRSQQFEVYFKLSLGRALERALGNFIVMGSSFIMFLFANDEAHISSSVFFSIMIIMNNFRGFLLYGLIGVGFYFHLKVVMDRIASVLSLAPKLMIRLNQEEGQRLIFPQQLKKGHIVFKQFNGYWIEDLSLPTLKNIDFHFRPGTLYGVTGKVGAGKSSLFSAILRQMPYFRGDFEVRGQIAFVQQQPIIFSDTMRNNITFGKEYSQEKYEAIVRQACLISDFKLLAKGDLTMVGEKGATLSGGQKARLSLARALYSEADIFLMDDPLSAVDSRVAKEIFYSCLQPLSQTKTVILTSHQISFIQECQEVIILDKGQVISKGAPSVLQDRFKQLRESFKVNDDEQDEKVEQEKIPKRMLEEREKQIFKEEEKEHCTNIQEEKFNEKEVNVSCTTYARFFFSNKANYVLVPLALLMFLTSETIRAFYYRFLADYDKVTAGISSIFHGNITLLWGVLGVLIVLYFLSLIIKYFLLNISILQSSQSLHNMILTSLLRSPCSYFDSISSGTLTNRFSNDLGILNNDLAFCMTDTVEGPMIYLVALLNLVQLNQLIIIPAVITIGLIIVFFLSCRPVLMKGKELALKTKSFIYHTASEAMRGMTQIKIYHQNQTKINIFGQIVDRQIKASIGYIMVNRGFGVSLMWIISLFIVVSLFLNILTSNHQNSHLFPLTVIYLMTIGEDLQWILRQFLETQGSVVSAERILQLQHNKQEAQLRTPYDEKVGLTDELRAAEKEQDCHVLWPEYPRLQLDQFSARYREGLPLVLKNISLSVEEGEKVGIVGRTGAGKSSIVQALFRMFEPQLKSSYQIGGFDALSMGLHSLRQHISVIPQVPFLFQGTVRENIDPFEETEDQEIWRTLEEVDLKILVQKMPYQLQTEVSSNSETFSVGQKQLLCVARALLRRNRILVLDEATSNVDMKTDAFIQDILRSKFKQTTVITIAHRLSTVADYDKIVVMKEGRVEEVGPPFVLLEKKGLFYEMVMHTGRQAEMIFAKAKNSFESKYNSKKRI